MFLLQYSSTFPRLVQGRYTFTVHAADSVWNLTIAVTTTDTAMRARMKKDVASIVVDY
jgi:hypothetical protein